MQKPWKKQRTKRRIWLVTLCVIVISCNSFVLQATSAELRTAFQDSYPKYYWSDPEKKEGVAGLCVDIIRAIEKSSGIRINAPGGFLPFKRLQAHLADGKIDIFIGMAKNDTRLKQYIFIDTPLYEVNLTVAVRKNDRADIYSIDDIRNLAPDNIILTNFGTATERFLRKQKGLSIDSKGKDLETNLKKLAYNRGRLVCFHDIGLLSAIKRYGHEEKVKILPCTLKKYYHYVAFSPTTSKELIARIDKAVQELTRSGELKEIRSRYVTLKTQNSPL